MDFVIDILFGLDVIIIFNSAYYDIETNLIDKRRQIAMNYVQGWFIIDILAIIPFDLILEATDFNQMIRVARVGRLYRLVKLTRLFRILKIMKEKNKLLKYINQFLKIGLGFERLIFFVLIFLILCHICACLWIIMAAIINDNDYEGTWLWDFVNESLDEAGKPTLAPRTIYTIAFYWTITTITTVGYGDIGGSNSYEKIFCSIVMIIGVISFSMANGALASII